MLGSDTLTDVQKQTHGLNLILRWLSPVFPLIPSHQGQNIQLYHSTYFSLINSLPAPPPCPFSKSPQLYAKNYFMDLASFGIANLTVTAQEGAFTVLLYLL